MNLLIPDALSEEVCVFVSRLEPNGVQSLPKKFAHPEKTNFAQVTLQIGSFYPSIYSLGAM